MHDHDDDHDHHHDNELSPMAARTRALETILVGKGLINPAAVDALIDTYENRVGPRNGARVVAKAWTDPAFADWLHRDATAAIASLAYSGRQGEHMRAVFNGNGDTTSSSARFAHAIHGQCWVCPLSGTNPRLIALERSSIPAAFWPSLASRYRPRPGCECGIRQQSSSTLWYPNSPLTLRAGMKTALPRLSPATA